MCPLLFAMLLCCFAGGLSCYATLMLAYLFFVSCLSTIYSCNLIEILMVPRRSGDHSNIYIQQRKKRPEIIWDLGWTTKKNFWNHLDSGTSACLFQCASERVCLNALLCVSHGFVPLTHFGARPASYRRWLYNWKRSSPWADTACCLTWFGSIIEANRLLTPASIPHRFSHAYKPISAAVINNGLIIVSPDQSKVHRSTT